MIFYLVLSLQDSIHFVVYISEPPYYITDKRNYYSAIREAIAYWQDKGFNIRETKDSTRYNVLVQWIKEFGPEKANYERIGQAVIYVAQIGLGSSSCDGNWRPFNYETIVKIATHELGHILGFSHTNNPNDIMYPYTNTKLEYDYNFRSKIRTGESLFLRFCSLEKAEYYVKVESQEPMNFIVVPNEKEYKNYLERKKNKNIRVNYVKNCYETKTRIFEKVCVVDVSGGLIIEFPYSSLPKISNISVFIQQK